MSYYQDLYEDEAPKFMARRRVHIANYEEEYQHLKDLEDKYPSLKNDEEFQAEKQKLFDDLKGHDKPYKTMRIISER
jgi:tryptophan synthase beta subunit